MIEFVQTHWAEIAGVLAACVLVFDRIAKITPTQTDDKILAWVYKITAVLGVKVKDNPGG
tara:strand:- start:1411 stop:1590 length:180 start_codon:yes stop_codon:yes gene_type:complete